MVTSTCPKPDDLRSFHLGMLDEGRELEVLHHLNSCPTCEDTVANLEGTEDSLVAAVRSSVDSELPASDDRPALQQALAEIEGLVDTPETANHSEAVGTPDVTERIRDYELLGSLGEGGMGTVYRACHTRLDRQVALKLLPARRLRDNAAVARFEREMKAIGRLDHPTIVRATDAGDVDGTHFLAMDYVEGIDLSKLVRLVGPLDVASACEIVRQAALGLDYAHQQDLIHRDVKPSNLMLTLRGEVRILDLGLALFGAASEALDELTTVGQLMGTLDYMAPEQGDNSHDVDARADVYSLGATLFKLLTATAPYDSPGTRTPLAKMKALATVDAPSVAERREELPTDLVTIVDRALLRNVDDRFASAKELADSLLPFCEGHVLSDLAECGRDLALREDEKVPQPPTLPPFVSRADVSVSEETPASQIRVTDNEPGPGRKLARWMLIPIVLLAGILIWLQTNNGTLLIEADESVPIEIRRTGKPVQRETLKVGQNSLTISCGNYEIVLPREYDSLKIENGKFELSRGGTWIARVTKHSAQPAPTTAFRQPADLTQPSPYRPQPNLYRPQPNSNAPSPASSDPFALPDPFTPQPQAVTSRHVPLQLQTTVWRIDQKTIRNGATKPVELRPHSVVGLLSKLVSLKFSTPQHPYLAFGMFRTQHDVASVLTQPGLAHCTEQIRSSFSRHDHTQQTGPLTGPLNSEEVSEVAKSDGRRVTLKLTPVVTEGGRIELNAQVNRTIAEPVKGEIAPVDTSDARVNTPTTQNFDSNFLAYGQSLFVLELDPLADEILLFEIHPVQTKPYPDQAVTTPGTQPPGTGIPGITTIPGVSPGRSVPGSPTMTESAGTLVFSGKTFEEWQRSVQTERNPVELRNAIEALCILGRNHRDAEAASTVLQVVDAYPCQLHRGGSEAELVASAIRYLRTLAPTKITPAVAVAAREGGTNTRTLILEFLAAVNGGPKIPIPYVGEGEALATQLRQSIELRDALIGIFNDLKPENRLRAFDLIVENLDDDDPKPTLVTFLENCSRNENPGRLELVAARRLADIKPSTRLADVFLTYLENRNEAQIQQTTRPGGMGGAAVPYWWSIESDAWMGLAALGKLASGSADRIARLIDNVQDGLAKPQTIYLMASPSRVKTRFEIHRQLLPIEILAMIGPDAKSTVPAINNVLKTLTGASPAPQGDYGFDGFHKKLVLERIIGQDARLGVPSPDALTADVEQIRDRPQRLDSALVAIRRITSQAARFDVSSIDANGARKATTEMGAGYPGGAMGSGYPGGGPAGMMEEYGGGDEYGESMLKQYVPRLVTYKGKSFAEWADTTKNFGSGTPLIGLQRRMQEVFQGVSLLAQTPEERKAAATLAIMVFDYAIRQSWDLTPELKKFLVTTIAKSYSHDPVGVLTPIEDALAQVTPARQAFILNELLMPVEETAFGFRLQPRVFSRKVVASSQFPNAYNDLVDNWDKHSTELREAILQSEAHLPALGQKNSVKLLTRLVQEAYESATSNTETESPISDHPMKAAFILAATEPKNAEVRRQLETLLARVLAKPHVLRLRRQAEATANKAKVSVKENARPATMQDLDADRLHAALGLKLSCGGSLSTETARQFARLIIQDTERHEVGKFRIVSPPNWPTTGISAPGSESQNADVQAANGLGIGGGYPGMGGSGYPGMIGAGAYEGDAMAADYSDFGYGEGMSSEPPIPFKGSLYIADHGEFSRRLLMTRLLLECPPEDGTVKNELGEQLAATLLKAYPQGFLPAPPTENNNVSVYDLIETEFRSGVRFRKQPTKSDEDLETARFIDAASAVVWKFLPDDRRMQLHQNRVAELQAAQIAATRPSQLYDGRPFEEWLTVVNTERSPQRLAEAVTALTILGKNGRDTEAAKAILKCLAPFSADLRGQKTPEGQLVSTIDDRFWQLDRKATAPVAADLIEKGNSSQRKFLLVHNRRHIINWIEPGGLLAEPRFVEPLLEATQDDDSEVRWQASAFLIPMLLTGEVKLESETVDQATEHLKSLLTDPRAKTPAAICLAQLAPETPGLTEILLAEIDQFVASNDNGPIYAKVSRDNHDSLQFSDAYWALRKLIVHKQTTSEELMTRLLDLLEIRRQGEPGRIFEVDYYRFDHRTLVAELLVAGTPRTQVDKSTIRDAFTRLANSAAQLPNGQASNGEFAENNTQSNLPAYTPVLTDSYSFPLPEALRYPRSSAWEERVSHQRADEFRAAKWALEQLEKNSQRENADE